MSYWHIVDLLIVFSYLKGYSRVWLNPNDKNGTKAATTEGVAALVINMALNVLVVAYLAYNAQPDVARMFQTVAMCHP